MRYLAIPMNEKLPTEALAIGRRGYKPEGAGAYKEREIWFCSVQVHIKVVERANH